MVVDGSSESSLPMDLSVVIVNWNTREMLANCLESVASERDIAEVCVVDNASNDGSTQLVKQRFTWVRLLENSENIGFAAANNRAVRLSTGRYVLLLNSDTKVFPGALKTMVEFMEQRPQVAACGPLLLNTDGSLQVSCYPMLTPERELWRLLFLDQLARRASYPQEHWNRDTPRQVEVIKGACLMLRRAALDEVGLLDEKYFMYTEEMDLCYRLLQGGWQLWWVPQAVVRHYGEASTKQVAEAMYVQLYRSKVQFHRKFGGSLRAKRFKRIVWLAYVPRLVVAALGAPLSSDLATQAHTFRRLLAELPAM
jgi:GT2 family glycosyltransferase